MTTRIYRPEDKHPEPYQSDLNPDASAGLNWGLAGPHPELDNPRTAKDVKEAHRRLAEFTDDELQRIPILPTGARLEANATYINLRETNPHEFKAEGYEEVHESDFVVPKSVVDYRLWNRLLGVTDVERTGVKPK